MEKIQVGPDIHVFEVTEDCGCVWIVRELNNPTSMPDHIGAHYHAEVKRLKKWNGVPMQCDRHKQQAIDEAERRGQVEQHKLERSELLQCSQCGAPMGFVYENDLNGSRFYCYNCKNK